MRDGLHRHTWIICKELNPSARPTDACGRGLAGLSKSRALFSFQRAGKQRPFQAEEADEESSLRSRGSQRLLRRGPIPTARAIYVRKTLLSTHLTPGRPGSTGSYAAARAMTNP